MKKICLGIAVCYFVANHFNNLHAQNYPYDQVTIASPNAASLGKYADFPVSYHTGIPNIDIPLYTVEHGPLKLPISLSYHSGGLKVEETASWVGRGWALNAGGVITRSVRGGPDDRGLNAAVTQWGFYHDYGYTSYLHEVGGPDCSTVPCPPGAPRHADDFGVMHTTKDGEPDLYFFNFGKYQGKFYFHDDRTPVMVPHQDFKIEPILANETSTIAYIFMLGFKITTPDGTKYYFGKNQEADGNPDATEITYNTNTHSTFTGQGVVSSWFLNKIVSADDLFTIKLTYESDQFSTYSIAKFPIMNVSLPSETFKSWYGDVEYDLAKEFINGVRLKEIIWANGKLTFTEGTLARKDLTDYTFTAMTDIANTTSFPLDAIEINNLSGFCKKFKFYTSYFQDLTSPMNGTYTAGAPSGGVNSDKYSLRLDSLQEMTCNNTTKLPIYKFNYNTGKVSRKISFGQDHWGFYNGVISNGTLIPTYWVNDVDFPGADREPNETAMKGGILEKITYPTGGYTQFDYEPHDTHGTIVSKSWSSVQTINDGYDGTPANLYSPSFTLSAGTHRLEISNTNYGSTASIAVVNSSNVWVKSLSAAPGETKFEIFQISSSGTYKLFIEKQTVSNGNGATGNLCKLATASTTADIMVGGLRIKTITTNDGITTANQVKNFTYGTSDSGRYLYSRPVYIAVLRNDIWKTVGGGHNSSSGSVNGCFNPDISPTKAYRKSGSSITPMGTTQGNHIGYEEIKVAEAGGGYSIYRYYGSNIWGGINSDVVTRNLDNTVCALSAPNFPTAPVPFEFERGEIKYEGHFNEGGQALLQKHYYHFFEEDTMTTFAHMVSLAGYTSNSAVWLTEYELRSAKKTRTDIITTETDPASGTSLAQTTREFYGSKFHNQPTRNVTFASNADSLITLTKYTMDYRVAACDNINSGYQSFITAYNTVLSNYYAALACTNPPGNNCKWHAYQKFRWDRTVARKNYIDYRKANFTDPGSNFEDAHLAAKNAAGTEFKPVLQLQDDYKIAPVEVTTWRNANLFKAVFIRYDYSTSPATSVYPNKLQVVNLASPSTTFTHSTSNGTNAITKDTRYKDENVYKYIQGNIVEITKKNGVINSYIWGVNNSVPIVKAVGVSHATLNTAYTAAAGNLTTMRANASLAGALITTYSYSPILGMTGETNENVRGKSYEYDVLGRLKYLKDHDANVLKVIDYQFQVLSNQ